MKRDGLGWQPPLLPDDPTERRIRLVILAALGVIAQIISTIAAWW